jgi:CheY-like chemotaxis protein
MPRLELISLNLASGAGCNARPPRRALQPVAPPRWANEKWVQTRAHDRRRRDSQSTCIAATNMTGTAGLPGVSADISRRPHRSASSWLLEIDSGSFRALVTDINLDGKMDGWEVAQHAREIEPEFPVVYMSGAAAADWTSKGVPNSIMLAKPFAPAQLLTAVSNLLNSWTPTA